MTDPDARHFPNPSGEAGEAAASPEDWVVIVEAAADPAYEFQEVRQLVSQLDSWQSTGLYSLERYAVQVRIPAADHHAAVTRAVALHDQAIAAMGAVTPSLLRVEVLTVGELQAACERTAAEAPAGRVYDALIPTILYEATRALFRATSRSEIDQVLTRFVIGAGGTVNIGDLTYFPGQVSVDLGVSPGDRMYASADADSVAGLLIEHSLPALIHDADRMLSMLHLADQPHLG